MVTQILDAVFGFTYFFVPVCSCFGERSMSLMDKYLRNFWKIMPKVIEEAALNSPSEIVARAFIWTLDSLDEDHELERFFSSLPGFCSSEVVADPLPHLHDDQRNKLSEALFGFFHRTSSSDLLSESVKSRRAIICARALDAKFLSSYGDTEIMRRVLSGDECKGVRTTKFGHTVISWGSGDEGTAIIRQAIVIGIVAKVQQRDDSWFSLASNELGVAEPVLRDYAAQGDSLSLAILVHVTRRHFNLFQEPFWPTYSYGKLLEAASKFNVRDTLPELQREFCTLWNEIVLKAQNDEDWDMGSNVLRPIRNAYDILHRDTGYPLTPRPSPSAPGYSEILAFPLSYPVCEVPGHIHDYSAFTTLPHVFLPGVAAPVPSSIPDVPSSSVPAPPHSIESLIDVQLPVSDKSVRGPILSAHQSAIENVSIPTSFLDRVTTHVIQGGIETSTKEMPFSTTESSAPASHPIANISTPSGDVAIQNVTDRNPPSAVSVSPSPTPLIANAPPIGPSLSSDFP